MKIACLFRFLCCFTFFLPIASICSAEWPVIDNNNTYFNHPSFIQVDTHGNVYCSGYFSDYISYRLRPFLQKRDRFGNLLWSTEYTDAQYSNISALGFAVDELQNVYLTLYGGNDEIIIKYARDGALTWTQKIVGSSTASLQPRGVYLSPQGGIVACAAVGSVWDTGFLINRYSVDGALLWSKTYKRDGDIYEGPFSCVINSTGDIYIVGSSRKGEHQMDIVTMKYADNGTRLWLKIVDAAGRYDYGRAIQLDHDGNVLVGGDSLSSDSYDFYLIKYASDGQKLWQYRALKPETHDHLRDMVVDDEGNSYLTGRADYDGHHCDYLTIKVNSKGELVWQRVFEGPKSSPPDMSLDQPASIHLDGQGGLFVTGTAHATATQHARFATVKYSTDGEPEWVKYFGSSIADSQALTSAYDSVRHRLYVAGTYPTPSDSPSQIEKYALAIVKY